MIEIRDLIKVNVTAFFRRPVNLGLIVFGIPSVIYGFYVFMRALPDFIFPEISAEMGAATGTLFAVVFLVGLVGLFQIISSLEADRRLCLSGFSMQNILIGRFLGIFIISTIISALSLGVMSYWVFAESYSRAFLVLTLSGFMYGMIGVLIGSSVPKELEASLILIFLADLDVFLGTGFLDFESAVVEYFPLHSPSILLRNAVLNGHLDNSHLLVLGVYILVFLYFSSLAFKKASSDEEGWF